ncbi:MAG: SDR family NAD(P)-dependent oxidoreductase [Thermaerobacter sp.]|nr:SDR family NAD(P)-dependent oxidoreductase [Thermaerobacter sp.]
MPISERSCAVVTGASSGIGAAFAAELAAQGHYVVLIARRTERLAEVLGALPEGAGESLVLDVAAPGSAEAALAHLAQRGLIPDLLINNAGIGDYRPLLDADLERLHAMIEVNSRALLDWTYAFLLGMRERRRGAVIQVASGIVFVPAPKMATYAASKAFVHALGEALPFELQGTGVSYLTLYPGSTESEFFVGAGMSRPPGTVPARQVAREGLAALARGKTRHVVGAFNRFGTRIMPFLPRGFVARMAARMTQ